MLILRRKIGESVFIDGGAVCVTVDDVGPASAMIRFDTVAGGFRVEMRLDEIVDVMRPRGGYLGTVMLARIGDADVNLGFTFPPRVAVDREEIHHLKHETRWRIADAA